MSEEDDALIEQLRAFGISAEELEMLVRKSEQAESTPEQPGVPAPPPGAFDPLDDTPLGAGPVPEAMSPPGGGEISDSETSRLREQAIAEAQDAAAQIRLSAIRLISEKLQSAEDEVMALRVRAADEIAKLRSDTARSMVERLREAESEAQALKEAARERELIFWRTTLQEFLESQQSVARVRSQLSSLVSEITDSVASVEASAYSIVAMCQRRLDELSRLNPPEPR